MLYELGDRPTPGAARLDMSRDRAVLPEAAYRFAHQADHQATDLKDELSLATLRPLPNRPEWRPGRAWAPERRLLARSDVRVDRDFAGAVADYEKNGREQAGAFGELFRAYQKMSGHSSEIGFYEALLYNPRLLISSQTREEVEGLLTRAMAELPQTLRNLAESHRYAEAERLILDAVIVHQRRGETEAVKGKLRLLTGFYEKWAQASAEQGDGGKAAFYFRHALVMAQQVAETDFQNRFALATGWQKLGEAFQVQNNFLLAAEAYWRAADLCEELRIRAEAEEGREELAVVLRQKIEGWQTSSHKMLEALYAEADSWKNRGDIDQAIVGLRELADFSDRVGWTAEAATAYAELVFLYKTRVQEALAAGNEVNLREALGQLGMAYEDAVRLGADPAFVESDERGDRPAEGRHFFHLLIGMAVADADRLRTERIHEGRPATVFALGVAHPEWRAEIEVEMAGLEVIPLATVRRFLQSIEDPHARTQAIGNLFLHFGGQQLLDRESLFAIFQAAWSETGSSISKSIAAAIFLSAGREIPAAIRAGDGGPIQQMVRAREYGDAHPLRGRERRPDRELRFDADSALRGPEKEHPRGPSRGR